MKKNIYKFFITILICIQIPLSSFAHSGKTDSNGGHYNKSTGEYHYHHGYSAHQHINGECPYDYKNNSSVTSSTNTKKTEKSKTNTSTKTNSSSEKKSNIWETLILILLCCWWFIIPIFSFLIDLFKEKVLRKEKKSSNSQKVETELKTEKTNTFNCPRCNGQLIIKKGKYGNFIGCKNYPYCSYTKSLNNKNIKK